jgi:hypothetical protein
MRMWEVQGFSDDDASISLGPFVPLGPIRDQKNSDDRHLYPLCCDTGVQHQDICARLAL